MAHCCSVLVLLLLAVTSIVDTNDDAVSANEESQPGSSTNMFTPLGQGFFLPDSDILDTLTGGQMLYQNISAQDCFEVVENRITGQSQHFFRDSLSFYSQVSVDSGISANLQGPYTMSTTLKVKSNSESSGFTEVEGTSLDIYTFTNRSALKKSCFSSNSSLGKAHLSEQLIQDYKSLQINITNPQEPTSWEPYTNFLRKYGSHFVTQVKLGAQLQQWTFAKQSSHYTQDQLAVRACADFEGMTEIGKLNITSCTGYASKDAEAVQHLETTEHLDIKGGTDETRAKLRAGDRSKELITKFLTEGRKYQTPVDYVFEGIWEMLKLEFPSGDPYHAIALNLEQYYKGFLDFGCTPEKSANGMLLRWFNVSRNSHWETPEYQCEIERDGCHNDGDCHKGGAGTVTYCYGPSCVEYVDPAPGTKSKQARIRYNKAESYKVGINKSCYYHLVPSDARCHGSGWSNNQVIWIGDMGPVLEDSFNPMDPANQNENPPKHDEI